LFPVHSKLLIKKKLNWRSW